MTTYYTYNESTKQLAVADRVYHKDGKTVIIGNAADFANYLSAYPASKDPAPTPPEGKMLKQDGYVLSANAWTPIWEFVNIPLPSLSEYDALMEEHLREERDARGYTSREPDSYLTSSVPRWKQDAEDWVAHRDEVMEYALEVMNGVQKGEMQQPTLQEFKDGLPTITWTFSEPS